MPWAKHWDIRRHIKDFREPDAKFEKGGEARYTLLDYLLLRSNPRLRTYIGVQSIIADTGFAKPVVAGALAWLFDRGAIYNVPHRFRVGTETELEPRKYVFQLTGIIRLGDQWVRYLLFSEEDAAMMLEEWRSIGMEIQVDEAFFTADRETFAPVNPVPDEGDDPESSLSEHSQSERSLKSPLRSTSLSPSSTSLQAIPGGQAASDIPATPRRRRIQNIPLSMLIGEDEEVEPDSKKKKLTRHDNIIAHEMVVYFMDELRLSSLTSGMVKDFTEPIRLKTEDGWLNTGRNLLDMWETEPGFAAFCEVRIPQTQTWSDPMTPPNILKHLKKLNKEDGIGGFYKWCDANPTQIEEVGDGEEARDWSSPEQLARNAARFANDPMMEVDDAEED